MEATFCLGRHPLSTSLSSLPFTSNISNLSATNHFGRIRHSSLSLNSGYLRSSHTHMLRLVMCTFDRLPKPQSNNLSKADNNPRSMVGVAAVLACVLGIIGCSSRKYHRAMAQGTPSPLTVAKLSNQAQGNTSKSLRPQILPEDGRYALNSLLEVFRNGMASQVGTNIAHLPGLSKQSSRGSSSSLGALDSSKFRGLQLENLTSIYRQAQG